MGQTTIVLMILTVISKIFGFVRESVMASYIGAGELKSIYTTAMTIPTFIMGISTTGIVSGYIPIYNKVNSEKGEAAANDFTNNLLNILMVFGSIAFVFSFIFARPISKLFSPGLAGDSLALATSFTRIICLSIFPFLYSSVIRGFLNIKDNFTDPIFTPIIEDIILIISIALTAKIENSYILIIGALLANIIQFIRFPFVSKKLGFTYYRRVNFKDSYVKYLMVLIIPIIISSAADQLSIIVDNSVASAFFGESSVSKIFYAKTMLGFIMGVVTMSVTSVAFPLIAKLAQEDKIEDMKKEVGSAVVIAMILVIPATLGMMVLSTPIIKIAFERNAFTSVDTTIVANLMSVYAPYIIFTTIINILSIAFYSVRESRLPVVIVLGQQVLNFILNFIFIKLLGLNGLALATSASTAVGSICMLIAFYKRFGKLKESKNILAIIKILLSSVVMIFTANLIYNTLLSNNSFGISLLVSVLLAIIVYLVCIWFAKIDIVDGIKENLNYRLKGEK